MRHDLVEGRGWYSDDEYQQGLAIAQTMPGPLAAQLAMWLGYLERGALGALLVALPFIVPPFLLVTAVAALYAHYQGLSQVQSVFFGVGPAVMAIIGIAAYKLARSTNKHDPLLWAIAAIVCASTVISGSEIVWLFLAAGLLGALYYGGGLPRLRGRRRCRRCRWRRSRASSGSPPLARSERWRCSSPRQARSPSAPGSSWCPFCIRAW
jgi:chromate transporter